MENNHQSTEHGDSPEAWADVLGPVFSKSDIGEVAQSDDGLIVLETSDGVEVCPAFQFDKNSEGVIIVHPDIAKAWGLLKALQIDQLGESRWTTAGRLTAPRIELDGQSWTAALRDSDEQTKDKVYDSIVEDAIKESQWIGIPLVDPRAS